MNAVGACGLQLYRFGEAVSIVFFTETWRPTSFYDKIAANRKMGLHTLCLLDIKVKEPNFEMLARGKTVYEPPRYMSINTVSHHTRPSSPASFEVSVRTGLAAADRSGRPPRGGGLRPGLHALHRDLQAPGRGPADRGWDDERAVAGRLWAPAALPCYCGGRAPHRAGNGRLLSTRELNEQLGVLLRLLLKS